MRLIRRPLPQAADLSLRRLGGRPIAAALTIVAATLTSMSPAAVRPVAAQHYYAYVAAESEDQVALVHFDGKTIEVEQTTPVGLLPADIEGPHGVAVSPDGQFWFVTMAHGNPFGTLFRFRTGSNEPAGSVTLGLFPATIHLSPTTGLLYAVNFNLHGDMVPSTVSVVDPRTMTELAKTTTGVMPHGSRLSPDGLKHYSVSMMDGMLHEIDAITFALTRSLDLDAGYRVLSAREHAGHQTNGQARHTEHSEVKPTWASPHPTRPIAYVAGNGVARILEVNLDTWTVDRTFGTAAGPYNLDISPDGKWLVATYKGAASTGLWDLDTGTEVAVIRNTRRLPHGIAITPDSRFAFVTVEGVGSQPGTVDVIDLHLGQLVATVDVGKQAGGIAFWQQSARPVVLPGE